MTGKHLLFILLCISLGFGANAQGNTHVWEMQELSFTAANTYKNPYIEVKVWVELTGPGFNKRVYGFWDGANSFKVRVVAMKPGTWTWKSGSSTNDPGLSGKMGSFTAIEWTDREKNENPLRRGFIRASANKHALIYADSTPYFAIGDTWFGLGASRYKWYDDEKERPMGPDAGFKDFVRYRKAQGFNWINLIAAFPNWKTDDKSWLLRMDDSAGTTIRSAWMNFDNRSAKNMDNEGGAPFLFPGKVPGYENYFPDMDKINPEYFKYLDKKIAYLNQHGFVPFIEASRRDASLLWSKYYEWPGSYTRFVQYIYSRYQAYNTILGPVHLDIIHLTISPDEYSAALKSMEEEYGPLPFENLLSANANPSTLENWGDSSWVTLHQMGNKREHNFYWYLTEIFYHKNPAPALNGEPYYAGYNDPRGSGAVNYTRGAKGGTDKDNAIVRSGSYGSFLSGAYAGHVYGAEGIWGGDVEEKAPVKMWDAFTWKSAGEMQHLKTFAFSVGERYRDLEPQVDLVTPNRNYDVLSYEGWAYCSRTPDRKAFLIYFERNCPIAQLRGAELNSVYSAQWFDPRTGKFSNAGDGRLTSSNIGVIRLPHTPDDLDWGLKLEYIGEADNTQPVASTSSSAQEKPGPNRRAVILITIAALFLLAYLLGRTQKKPD
ncbi:MAG: DUF4038 domain-containing protein [Chitinophagaceae bacterium]|nr:DUF4038 domain-containing protein [Chitinophagaceae bacterium]